VWKCNLNDDFEWHYNYKLGRKFRLILFLISTVG
jgi:hypothetical protein